MLALRSHRVLLCALVLATAGVLLAPAAAHAAVIGEVQAPFAIFGISIKDLVGKLFRAVVGFVVPDFAEDWASAVVTWLVAVPNVTKGYPSLADLRASMVPVGIGIAGVCFTISALEFLAVGVFAAPASRAVDGFVRTACAIAAITFFPRALDLGITATNIFSAELIRNPNVVAGINDLLGGALILTAIAGALSLGLAAAAALVACYFVAGLFVFKAGLVAILAVLYVASPLVWGLYPLASSRWITRTHTAGTAAALLIPVVWALIFATGGVLGRDALLWSSPGQGLSNELEALARPFAAVALLYVAYKAPMLLLAMVRSLGLNPSAFMPGSSGSGGGAGRIGRSRATTRGTQRAGDRFRGLRVAAASSAGRGAGLAGARAHALRDHAAGRARRAAGRGALNLAGATSPKVATGAIAAVDRGQRGVRRTAAATGRGADWWRNRTREAGADYRRQGRGARAAVGASRRSAHAQRLTRLSSAASRSGDGSRPTRVPRPTRPPAGVVALAAGRTPRAVDGDRASKGAARRAPRGRAPLAAPRRVAAQQGRITTSRTARAGAIGSPGAPATGATRGSGVARSAPKPARAAAPSARSRPAPARATPRSSSTGARPRSTPRPAAARPRLAADGEHRSARAAEREPQERPAARSRRPRPQ